MNDNWLIESLKWTFEFWNNKQTEIWQLVSTTPEKFKGGDIWRLALTLNDGLKAIGYGLLVLFLAYLCVEINPQFYWGKIKTLVYENLLVVK